MDASPYKYIIYVCIVGPNWDIHAAWECSSNSETIVTQIESQSSFNKDSGGPKNKEQHF